MIHKSINKLYRPFRAFIRAFGNWSAQQPPIFSIASENRFFSEKNGKNFLGATAGKVRLQMSKIDLNSI